MNPFAQVMRTGRGRVVAAGTVLLTAGIVSGAIAGVSSASASSTLSYSGDFSSNDTAVKRLANCAGTAWYNDHLVGDQLTGCDDAGSDSYWDGMHLASANEADFSGRQVGSRSDQSCPGKSGFQYVKCYYVGGKAAGNPVITISVISSGSGGAEFGVDWYYL